IGYSSCHWCHVMERESFENEEIAQIMNEHFVCIKVDREERPDVDQVYMNAVQLITGSGGWPLNCFALPDGSPVYGGTYYPPAQWKDLLGQLSQTYKADPKKVEEYAAQLKEGVAGSEIITVKKENTGFKKMELAGLVNQWKKYFDTEEGGNNRAPKFPLPNTYEFMLSYFYHSQDNEIFDHLNLSLDKMAMGGIYDQIGGGFARYSTDMYWKVPHFEKMLYDNGQLVSLYSIAFQATGKELYRKVVEQTMGFIMREMTSPNGGFYSSYDADSEGVEGKFYVWGKEEVDELLGSNSALINSWYNITAEANWEEGNILFVTEAMEVFCKEKGIKVNEFKSLLENSNELLLKERNKRVKPGLDDKILTSWNALMLNGIIDAYRVLGNPEYLDAAKKNADFLLTQMDETGRLNRNFKEGRSTINAFLDDYSFTIQAFIALYQVTFDESWLQQAQKLAEYTLAHFYDDQSGMFFYTSDIDPGLIARKMELSDNVIPSSNSAMGRNLYLLGVYFDKPEYIDLSRQMLSNMKDDISSNVAYHTNWAQLMLSFIFPPSEVVISGPKARELRTQLDQNFLPNIVLAGGTQKSSMPLMQSRFNPDMDLIYVCQGNVCKLPVGSVNEALVQIQDR
ncbi:MAG: thioredoxin domain-containing protein, partial [Bacteroidales bacterium]|nr:thioredoxin domain-containing protein [Bacteroidales bacterium]